MLYFSKNRLVNIFITTFEISNFILVVQSNSKDLISLLNKTTLLLDATAYRYATKSRAAHAASLRAVYLISFGKKYGNG